ncbi:prepilin peptidase [Caldicellulosiruptor morganii]|uniref:Prepilin peptidase n=1 Tax=Caldicellulosiruptor morganii TaxID=1387555 RepID=A0ABY7BL29_9FIRM|nr:A24 family peptidase [Caldicellulosiruptor morganii]WAM33200.1 prepilin peptidase [Caldicellulosiruptor morganii]
MFGIFAFVMGLVIGSFLNVCIYRLPRGESIIAPGSRCPRCGKRLGWFELIPVLSYLIQKGRCRGCREKISIQYPLVELLTGLNAIMAFNFYFFQSILLAVLFFIIGCLLIYIGAVDFNTFEISTLSIIFLLVLKAVFEVLRLKQPGALQIMGLFMGSVYSALLVFMIYFITRERAMGLGDVLLLLAGGFGFSFGKAILCNMLSFISAAIYGIIYIAATHKLEGKDSVKKAIPFGPFISLGIYLTMVFGERILELYKTYMIG